MTSMLMHLLMTALLIFLGYCLCRADGAIGNARRIIGAGGTAPKGHNGPHEGRVAGLPAERPFDAVVGRR